MSGLPRRFRPAERTKAREEVMEHAGKAVRHFPGLDVVRFIIPSPVQYKPWDATAAAQPMLHEYVARVCSVSRERGYLHRDGGYKVRLLARFHDARHNDTFFSDERGGLWEMADE